MELLDLLGAVLFAAVFLIGAVAFKLYLFHKGGAK